jgi:hypothetical protein
MRVSIWDNRTERTYLLSAVLTTSAIWGAFKYFYPYPNVIFDSYYYVKAAALHWNYNAWPIGYSKFLDLFARLSSSSYLLVTFQYFLVEFSCLVFFFNWRAIFRPGKLVSTILFVLLFANPLLLFCCNFITSDALFIAVSLLWVTQLLYVIRRPMPYMAITHVLLLLMAFTIRYNALYYPLLGAVAFLISRSGTWFKVGGILTPLLLVGGFILFTRHEVAKGTGVAQFSAFGSWKLANDALYVYAHLPPDKPEDLPPRLRALDSDVRKYYDQFPEPTSLAADDDFTSGSRYMYFLDAPLVTYMARTYPGEMPLFLNTRPYWQVAPLYQDYALYLIRRHPLAFARWFIWPNLGRYLLAPPEIFDSRYTFVLKYSGTYYHDLFHLDAIYTPPGLIKTGVQLMWRSAGIVRIGHVIFIVGLFAFLFSGGFRQMKRTDGLCIIFVLTLWACDFCFSIVSAAIVLRYQLFVMVPELSMGLFFIEYACRSMDRRVPVIVK